MVSLLADFILWLFGVDDGHCEGGTSWAAGRATTAGELHRLLRVAHNPEAPLMLDDPLAAGLRDLRLRVDRYGTAGQAARWVDTLREYFFAVVWEAGYRRSGTVPRLNDYTLMRLYDGATTVVLPLLEMGHGYELQPHERDRTEVRAVTEMASFIITWDNDIFSYHKEKKEKKATGYYLNALRVMEEHSGLTPEQALAEAISQRDRVMCLYADLTAHLTRHGSPQLGQYLRSIGHSSGEPRTGASALSGTRLPTTRRTSPPSSATPPWTTAGSRSTSPSSGGGGTSCPNLCTRVRAQPPLPGAAADSPQLEQRILRCQWRQSGWNRCLAPQGPYRCWGTPGSSGAIRWASSSPSGVAATSSGSTSAPCPSTS